MLYPAILLLYPYAAQTAVATDVLPRGLHAIPQVPLLATLHGHVIDPDDSRATAENIPHPRKRHEAGSLLPFIGAGSSPAQLFERSLDIRQIQETCPTGYGLCDGKLSPMMID